ncbi:hypothetical protein [Curtobacterium sp. MCBD17_028]|uniref:hypothetical protein n=1 Tax=Curtobacterium sp. MCBD17_028 TaxID=2175670 RepID=UPI0015E88797|nr:hypothetical protein [Curtobacterium sp. MCBD17_028]
MDAAALAIAALIVSILAALFTGWQAWTAHLERTRPRPASFTLLEPQGRVFRWHLRNTGGSFASHIEMTIRLPQAKDKAMRTRTYKALGAAAPGEVAELDETHAMGFALGRYQRDGDGKWQRATGSGGKLLVAKRAHVRWRDYKGRQRKGRVRLQ